MTTNGEWFVAEYSSPDGGLGGGGHLPEGEELPDITSILANHLALGGNDQTSAYDNLVLLTYRRDWQRTYQALTIFLSSANTSSIMPPIEIPELDNSDGSPFFLEKCVSKLCHLIAKKADESKHSDQNFRQFLLNAAEYNNSLAEIITAQIEKGELSQEYRVNPMICHLWGHAAWLRSKYAIISAQDDNDLSLEQIQLAQSDYLRAIDFADRKNLTYEKFIYGISIFENTIDWLESFTPRLQGSENMGFGNLAEHDGLKIAVYIAKIITQRPNFFSDTSNVLRRALNNVALPVVIHNQDGNAHAMVRRNADVSLGYFTELISDRAVGIIDGYSQARKSFILAKNQLTARPRPVTQGEDGYTLTAKNLGDNFLVYELMLLNIALLLRQNEGADPDEERLQVVQEHIKKLNRAILDDTKGIIYLRGEGTIKSDRGIMMANPGGTRVGKIFNDEVANNLNVKAVLNEVERFLTINSHLLSHPGCIELTDSIRAFLNYFKPIEGAAGGQYSKKRKDRKK
jgi:hypothetical protein